MRKKRKPAVWYILQWQAHLTIFPQKYMLSETKFLELYQQHQESGLTVRDFCSNEGDCRFHLLLLAQKDQEK
jgi:hypothetical protein